MQIVKTIITVIKETVDAWQRDNAMRFAASLSFYTIFSLAPALLIVLAIAEFLVGQAEAQAELSQMLQDYLGPKGTSFVLSLIAGFRGQLSGTTATIIGAGAMFLGATVVFAELQAALNAIWNVESEQGGAIRRLVFKRIVSFIVVVVLGVFLVLSLVASTTLNFLTGVFADKIPVPAFITWGGNFALSFTLTWLLLMLMYKFLPDVIITWKDTAIGALITALLFTVGKSLIGIYLGRSALVSAYGAAGSFVVILVWVYYTSMVLFFGAELTQVYTRRHGSGMRPLPRVKLASQSEECDTTTG